MQGLKGAMSRLPWIWGMLLAALLVAGAATPAAARHILAPPSIHKASAPVDGHHFDHSAKHHRSFHHAVRRLVPDPLLTSSDASLACASALGDVPVPVGAVLVRAAAAPLPPPTGPPNV
jgi:hypothetical protein